MSKEKEMIDLLIAGTRKRSVVWTPTAEAEEFATTFRGHAAITIREMGRPFGEPIVDDQDCDYFFAVRDQDDQIVFSVQRGPKTSNIEKLIAAAEISGVEVEEDEVKFADLRRLHDAARRSALQADRTIDLILDDLKQKV